MTPREMLNEKTIASTSGPLERRVPLEDVLDHLPVSCTTRYRKGQTIYGSNNVSRSIYLVVAGTVGVSQITDGGKELLLELVRPDELFGESAFLDVPGRCEQAIAIEKAELMAWPISDIQGLVTKRPPLAMALLQFLAQRNAELTRRIESLSVDTIERRLARSLIRLSERLGTPEEDGSVRMMPFTHVMLSRYVGTTREVVTHHMNRLRKQGHVRYSREGIHLNHGSLRMVLDKHISTSAETSC